VTEPATRPPLVREFSAGGLVYRRRGDECLVVLAARRHPQSGVLMWTIPKGHIEPGETSETAAAREVREETGLDADVEQKLGDVTYWYARRDDAGTPVRVFKRVRFFLMRKRGGRFEDRDEEMDAVKWFPLERAENAAAFESERELVRKARKLLEAGR
jgi:8-oxo-dGTP pyrophosphatase MutT (NUDIX family)